jgi:hypothetical protein
MIFFELYRSDLGHKYTVAGFLEKAEDWMYSSANEYITGKKGLLEIIPIE